MNLLAASTPNDRQPTNPGLIVSLSNPAAGPLRVEDLYFTRSVRGGAWSPNGREIVFETDLTGRWNVWKVDARGGWPVQLVQSDDRQTNAVWSPDGEWIIFQQDTGGDELWNLYAIRATGSISTRLTTTTDIREESPHWSPDGTKIAINYKARNASVYDIALVDWKTRAVHVLTHEPTADYSWGVVGWSSDGKTLFANRTDASFVDSNVYSIDISNAKLRNITPHGGKILFIASQLSPDNKELLIDSNKKHGHMNVALLNVASRKLKWVTDTEWEASGADFSADGRSVAYSINADGQMVGFLCDVENKSIEPLNSPPGENFFVGNPHAFSPQGDRLLVSHQSATQPADLWVYDLRTNRAKQLTFSALVSLSSVPMPATQIVHYKSFDGITISAPLWMPFNLKRDGSNPMVVLAHGGPAGQSADYWSPLIAALVSRGYICIAPNVRGSAGYGFAFQTANSKDLGGGDLSDEIYALKFLEATGYVNPQKTGITGGSYGGFMALMAIGKYPDIWAAAVESYGILNWRTMVQRSDPLLREYVKGLLGDPIRNAMVYEDASPLKYIHSAKAPLLVLQGETDPRVPREESDQVVVMMRSAGQTVDVHYYANEGHGLEKRENQIDALKRTLDWFEEYMRNR